MPVMTTSRGGEIMEVTCTQESVNAGDTLRISACRGASDSPKRLSEWLRAQVIAADYVRGFRAALFDGLWTALQFVKANVLRDLELSTVCYPLNFPANKQPARRK